MWTTIGKQCFDCEEKNLDSEFLESATSALRALTQKLLDANAAEFLEIVFFKIYLIVSNVPVYQIHEKALYIKVNVFCVSSQQ